MSQTDRTITTMGRQGARRPRLWVTVSGVALGTAMLAASPAAAQTCGADQPGADTVTCPAGTYGSGINYPSSDGLTVKLNDPAIVVQGGGVSAAGSNTNTNDIVVNATSFGSITTSAANGIAAVNAGTGGAATVTMDAGSITTTGGFRSGLQANIGTGANPGAASVTLNGGSISTSGDTAFGILAQSSSTAASASVTMTGGSIQTSGRAAGIRAAVLGAGSTAGSFVNMTGGSIVTTGTTLATGITSVTSGSGTAQVRMSGGTVQSAQNDGIFGDATGTGAYDVAVTGGAVTGGSGTGAAVHVAAAAGGTLAIGSDATINAGASGIAISQTGGAVNFTTGGMITGAVNLAAVANTFTATGGAITGDVSGGGSTTLTINTAPGGTFTYGTGHAMSGIASVTMAAGSAEIDGAINTTGALALDGGTFKLGGGGTLTTPGAATLAAGSSLVVDGAGSSLTVNQLNTNIDTGEYSIRIANGGAIHVGPSTSSIARETGAHADVVVTGGGSVLDVNGTLGIGAGGTSTTSLTVSDGASASITGRLNMGSPAVGGPSTVEVTGAGSSLTLGNLSLFHGEVDVLAGGALSANTINFGTRGETVNLLVSGAGSGFTTTSTLTLGNVGVGTNIVTLAGGGVLNAAGFSTPAAVGNVGVLNIGGAEGAAATGAGTLNAPTFTFGAGTGRLNFNHTDADYAFAAAISGSGAINQVAGVTHLTGDSSGFTGQTTVSGGELHVDGTLGASGGAVLVQSGGVLGGAGTIAGSVNVADGVLAPGNSPGTLTITGDLTLASASHTSVQFGQAGVVGGPLNDLVKVNGNLTLDGALDVTASPGGSFDPGVYRIFSYDGTLTDNGLALGSTPAGSRLAVQTAISGQVNLVNYTGQAVNFWDGVGAGNDGVVQGGAGVWTAAATNWTLPTGTFNAVYDTSALAVFAAAPGAVSVSGPVSAAGMQFAVDGYHLSGDTIALAGGGASTIRVGDGSAAGGAYVATIDNVLTGATTLTKTDLGTLVLTGASTYTGGTAIAGGALQLGAGGASGSITGDVADNGVLAFDRSDAVTFGGAISGTGAVSQIGAGSTTLTGTNSYAGGTTISAGVLRGAAASFGSGAILDNAALVIDQGADATFASAINGAGRFTKMGAGQLTLTGAGTLTGATTVAAGALSVNGSLASSAFTVMSAATLKGSGTVGATTLQSGATVAPGNSIGVLHVNGAFVQQAGSTYQVEVDPTSAGASDQIAVTGSATLQPGAGLTVARTTAGNFHLGAVYTVLSATGGVSGTYVLGGHVQPVSAFLGLKDSYDAGHAYLTVVQTADPASAAGSPNQAAVVGGLPSSGDVPDAVLNAPTVSAAQKLLDQLAGDGHAAAKGAMVSDSRLVRDLAIGRVQTLFCSPVGLVGGQPDGACPEDARPAAWGQVFGGWGRTDGDANAGQTTRSTGGFLLGADAPLPAGWRAGGFAGYSRTQLEMDGSAASADVDSYHFGLYGGAQYGAVGLRLGGSYTFHRIDAQRSVILTNLGQQSLEASYDADTAQGFAQAGYRLALGKASLEPFAEAAYVAVHTQGFTEHGGSAALTGQGGDTDAVFSTLGVKPAMPLAFGQVQATLHGLLGWRHDYGDVDPASTMRFVAGGSPFSVQGAPLAKDAGVVEVGLDMRNDNAVFGFTYGAQGWNHDFDQSVRASFRLAF
ncbi:MAG TPA: autotransporter domain-containing protein [Caulobacteraceae bacterium]